LNIVDLAESFTPNIKNVIEKRFEKDQEMRSIFAKVGNFSFEVDRKVHHVNQFPSWLELRGCSMDFYSNPAVTMYSPPDPYTNYEKMLLPFDAITWALLIFVFIATLCLAPMVHLLSENHKRLLISENGKVHTINAIGILFGDSQRNIPDKNFMRVTVITFVMVFLVMRNAYQGEFLSKNYFLFNFYC
jgi:uncharacterized membrane protein